MIKSGLIFGALAALLILGSSTILTPLCAPCVGLFLGLLAGYVAVVFDKPASSRGAVRKGGMAGAITGGVAFLGSFIASIINGALVNPSNLEALYRTLGVNNMGIDQTTIWIGQIVGGCCIGLFNLIWMGVLGIAGGALWFQITGKNQSGIIMPPEQPSTPGF